MRKNKHSLSKRLLQIFIALGGLVPVGAGLAGIFAGPQMIDQWVDPSISLDSHFSYLSGLLLGIGLCFWISIPKIEKHSARIRMLTLIVAIGGLARLWALVALGTPAPQMLLALVMELIVTPAIAFWQYRLERSMR
jgi:hypothetical protein